MPLTNEKILLYRLFNQLIINSNSKSPEEVVHRLGAIQAQEYQQAKWGIGLRLPGSTEKIIEKAINEGRILRTHMLRPTWHFVAPEDIYYIQAATAHRVHAFIKHYAGKLELDKKTITKSIDVFTRSLEGKNYLTRKILQQELAGKKIVASGQRLAFILMYAEIECIICSGPRIGKQFTYALCCERAGNKIHIPKDEAVAKLAAVYFRTRGPAGIKDFCWWSSLTIKEAKAAIADCGENLVCEICDGKELYYAPGKLKKQKDLISESTFLMPDYDEYGISYADRGILFSLYNELKKQKESSAKSINDGVFVHMFIVNGNAAGTWNIKKDKKDTEVKFFRTLTGREEKAVKKALDNYKHFYNN